MSYWFTTLTLSADIPHSSLQTLLKTLSTKWLYVEEHGKNHSNYHLHILFFSDKYSRTDKYTAKFKTLYNPSQIENLPKGKLIVTKKAKNWKLCYSNYLLKEQHNKSFSDLQFDGFDKKVLKQLYKKANITNIIKDKQYLSFSQAPYVIFDRLVKQEQCTVNFTKSQLYSIYYDLAGEGYIIHHLFNEFKDTQLITIITMLCQHHINNNYEKNPNLFSQDIL